MYKSLLLITGQIHIDFCAQLKALDLAKSNGPVIKKLLLCILSSKETQLQNEIFKILLNFTKIIYKVGQYLIILKNSI